MFENRMLKRIFGPKWKEVIGGWRRLHNEEVHNFYSSTNIIRVIKSKRIRWAGRVARTGKMNAYNILVGKPEGKRPLRKPRYRLEDNIKMDFREIVWDGVDWIHMAQDRNQWWDLVNRVMNLRVP
jgi:hypothetical protein